MDIIKKNNNINKAKSLYKDIYGVEKGIIELNLSDFTYKNKILSINQNKGLIIFYAPWCKYCKKISDLLIKLALSNINLFNIYAVNAENLEGGNDYVCTYAGIKEFPTLKYILEDGTLKDYEYEYTQDNLIYFINMNI